MVDLAKKTYLDTMARVDRKMEAACWSLVKIPQKKEPQEIATSSHFP